MSTFENIWQFSPNAEILVIDDNSPNATGQVLNEVVCTISKVIVQRRPGKMGVGSAHKEALAYVRNKCYGALITMGTNTSHEPTVFPQIHKILDQYNYIAGPGFIEIGKIDYVRFLKLISLDSNILLREVLSITGGEITTSFRCFIREIFRKLSIDQMKADGFSFFLKCTNIICRTTKKILEIPTHFHGRCFGQPNLSKNEVYRIFLTPLRLVAHRFLGASWSL